MKSDTIKMFFIYVAYTAFLISSLLQNETDIKLGRYQYIFVGVIAVCLKMSRSHEEIQKFVIDNSELKKIESKVDGILENQQLSIPSSNRTSNEPILPPVILKGPESPENTPRTATVVYLDDLIKNKKLQMNGYEIEIVSNP